MTSDDETLRTILAALRACYGSLDQPSFHKVYETLRTESYREIIESLREGGIDVTDTTDLNDDVSIRVVLDRAGDQVGLALSGVGRFAAVIHQDPRGHYSWMTQPKEAPTPLAATTAQTVQDAGFILLDRALVSQSIAMRWYYDGATEVTLYQALFTDSDQIP